MTFSAHDLALYRVSFKCTADAEYKEICRKIDRGERTPMSPFYRVADVFTQSEPDTVHIIVHAVSKSRTLVKKGLETSLPTVRQAFPQGLRYRLPRTLVRDDGACWVYQQHEELERIVQPALMEHFEAYVR
ncbi:hypothetical protein VTN77DRAFT_5967 [Rasamsonia byssochlamydoides]|uniref:uncharacterized protein n=1 Tax=Rasamsonia byssochlamydoides TaxID=89139 RepID=UPI00374439A1